MTGNVGIFQVVHSDARPLKNHIVKSLKTWIESPSILQMLYLHADVKVFFP